MALWTLVPLAMVVMLALAPAVRAAEDQMLDDFEELKGWSTSSSEGASVEVAHDTGSTGMGLRLDFDFHGGGGYVILRKAFVINLPRNYAFTFQLRAKAPVNNFQVKLVDRSGENVWWYRHPQYHFPADWQQIIIKKRRFEPAWGPADSVEPKRIGFIELAITADAGGRGSVWIDDLKLERRDPSSLGKVVPTVRASTFVPEHEPERALDHKPQTSWRSGSLAQQQWLLLDFLKKYEYGGLVIDWDPEDYATSYQVQVSDDGESWTPAYTCTMGNGGRDYVYMPDAESRYVRLELQQSSRGQGYAVRDLTVEPFEFSASPNQFFSAVAADAPAGTYPKYFSGKQTYWTVVGARDDDKEGLLNEEGMLEVDRGRFSIEPFLFTDGALHTWNTVRTTPELAEGDLPIPSVTWQDAQVTLRVTAFAAGEPGKSALYAQYRVDNTGEEHRAVDLFLAIRPFQVLPPWQSLNMVGGVTSIDHLVFDARTAWVNGDKAVISLTPPDRFGAATFEEGSITDFLLEDKLPPRSEVSDTLGYASGAFGYRLSLAPGEHQTVDLVIPFHEPDAVVDGALRDGVASQSSAQLEATKRSWEQALGHVDFQLPPGAEHLEQTLKSTIAYILINREGPAIHPGSRNYARSWIRDGALTSSALLEMGFTEEVREFIRWFARFQFADGRVPCCVDRRGADPVPENDSNGEFVYTVAEYYRFTRDVGFLSEMWPAVVKAVDYIAELRQRRLTDEYKQPDKQVFYGLVPESISHEGYSGHPVHSYWDDFFSLRGLDDAARLAVVLGDDEHAASFRALHDGLHADLYASISRAIADHKIDYIPGSAELGDFDATSTAIAVTLGAELSHLPQAELKRTFDAYYQHVQERRRQGNGLDGYTPYELRNVEALVRLGERERAFEILNLLLEGQRPKAWHEWAEIVWRDPSAPKFIGDMPHTWVGSGFIRSLRSMFAYENEENRSLVLAAGLPGDWVMSDSGVGVKRLPTYYGVLSYTLRREAPDALRLRVSGDLTVPPGDIVIRPPVPQPLTAVTVNGRPVQTFTADSATIGEFPADVVLQYGAPSPTIGPTAAPQQSPSPSLR